MPRFLVKLSEGTAPASAQPAVAAVQGVEDATPARSTNALVVTGDAGSKQSIAEQAGVEAVYDDIQAVPQVADMGSTKDFLDRVREKTGEENTAPLIETEPTRPRTRADGGTSLLPTLTAGEKYPDDATPQFDSVPGSVDLAGAQTLHEQGVTGNGVIMVVLDTGVSRSQFSESRRLEGRDITPDSSDPWDPYHPHGTMSAGIAAGGPSTEGASPGFAPSTEVYPIKSTLSATELIEAQDVIIELAEENDKPIVVNNSWGFTQCEGLCDHPVTDAVRNAASKPGVYQFFAAGNQGAKCGTECSDTGISGPNSVDTGLTVAATGKNGRPDSIHNYSSRGGPSPSCGTRKPDVSAPTFGIVPWGSGSKNIGNGGGTSAACPQVAGTAALLLSREGQQLPAADSLFEVLRDTAVQVDSDGWTGCSGHGNVSASGSATRSLEPTVLASGFDKRALAVIGTGLASGLLATRFGG
jgi:hypothetical protein